MITTEHTRPVLGTPANYPATLPKASSEQTDPERRMKEFDGRMAKFKDHLNEIDNFMKTSGSRKNEFEGTRKISVKDMGNFREKLDSKAIVRAAAKVANGEGHVHVRRGHGKSSHGRPHRRQKRGGRDFDKPHEHGKHGHHSRKVSEPGICNPGSSPNPKEPGGERSVKSFWVQALGRHDVEERFRADAKAQPCIEWSYHHVLFEATEPDILGELDALHCPRCLLGRLCLQHDENCSHLVEQRKTSAVCGFNVSAVEDAMPRPRDERKIEDGSAGVMQPARIVIAKPTSLSRNLIAGPRTVNPTTSAAAIHGPSNSGKTGLPARECRAKGKHSPAGEPKNPGSPSNGGAERVAIGGILKDGKAKNGTTDSRQEKPVKRVRFTESVK